MAADSRDRSNFLNTIKWNANESCIRYIEAWSFDGIKEVNTANYREADLRDDQVNDWLEHKGDFIDLVGTCKGGVPNRGGIRLLICERLDYMPLGFRMSQSSFLAVERAFGLPNDTLAVLSSNAGEYSARFINLSAQQADSVVIMVKVPQMYQIGNFGLVMSHSFKTGITSVFLHGWNVLTDINYVTGQRTEPHLTHIRKLIRSNAILWTHPLLLPVILLKEHLSRASYFKGFTLLQITTKVEKSLGVTKTGRLTNHHQPSQDQDHDDNGDGFQYRKLENETERIQLTTTINTTLTDVISFFGVLKWDRRFCQFLIRTCHRLEELNHGDLNHLTAESGQKLQEWLDALECSIESNAEHAETLRAKLEIQLSVLYNFVTQADSSLNSRLATQTVLDSAAMKTLAFVTTLFLPPTFVATLLSMPMFNWQASSTTLDTSQDQEGGGVVVSHIWVYWAVTVPLTLVVLGGWRVWWHGQKKNYKRTYPQTKKLEV